MGALCNHDKLSSFTSAHDRRFSKHVHDNVHGNIYLDPLFMKFIDTEEFQRQGLELGIDPFDIQTVKLAGLLHDVGHGPFSHTFEQAFLPRVLNGSKWFDYIVRDSRACGLGCNFEFRRLLETMRVIDDEICYRAKEYLTIHKLFATRADLHRTVYMHAKVKAIELMVIDALLKANDHLKISSFIDQPAEYWKFCNEFSVPKDRLEHFKDITPQDIICSQQDFESDEKFPIQDDRISHLLPAGYEDRIVRVYSKKPELVEAVSEAFENFQLKTYRMKAQVHDTPEKKKRRSFQIWR
uniref:HD domain-containing protein n=1 Tax=Vitis vinifera TaxID=29760 RepID=F6HPP0_VITVI